MIKVIPPGSFSFDEPAMRLVDVHSRGVDRGWMYKRAAMFSREILDLRPEPGHSYLHLLAMGALESVGVNRNSDGFNEKAGMYEVPEPAPGVHKHIKLAGGLMEYYPTFVTNGHVYPHHRNTDPSKAIGSIKHAAYNKDMRRVELIIRVPHGPDWDTELQKLAEGKDLAVSMAAKVPYDTCTICGNRAPSRAQYCDHMAKHATEITKSGHQIGNINDQPNFFDISKVFKPADRIAYVLHKVASAGDLLLPLTTGAQLAEELGLGALSPVTFKQSAIARKLAAANKLAEIEKIIETVAHGNMAGGCATAPIGDSDMSQLQGCNLCDTLQSLNDAKICLSVQDFFRLVMGGSKCAAQASDISMVEKMLPGLFTRLQKSGALANLAADESYSPSGRQASRFVRATIEKLGADHSVSLAPVTHRASTAIISGRAMNVKTACEVTNTTKNAEFLSNEYAKYVITFAGVHDEDPIATRLTVLRNYLTV